MHPWKILVCLLTVPICLAGAASAAPPHRVVASWYGVWHEGRRMADGCAFHAGQLSAASRTLPLGTIVRVRNVRNGRSIDLPITDRGPYVAHRGLDVSRAAALRLGFLAMGLTTVTVEVLPGLHHRCIPNG